MTTGATILAILSTAAGALAAITVLVFLLACAPNSSPRQYAFLRMLMVIMVAAGAAALVGAVVALILERPWLAAGIGAAPIAAAVGVTAALFLAEA